MSYTAQSTPHPGLETLIYLYLPSMLACFQQPGEEAVSESCKCCQLQGPEDLRPPVMHYSSAPPQPKHDLREGFLAGMTPCFVPVLYLYSKTVDQLNLTSYILEVLEGLLVAPLRRPLWFLYSLPAMLRLQLRMTKPASASSLSPGQALISLVSLT